MPNVLEASGYGMPMLDYFRALLESTELNPPPLKGGTHLKIVGGAGCGGEGGVIRSPTFPLSLS